MGGFSYVPRGGRGGEESKDCAVTIKLLFCFSFVSEAFEGQEVGIHTSIGWAGLG